MAAGDMFEEQAEHFLKFSGAVPLEPNAIFIVVMGMTGAGKSTFISRCTAQPVQIGHDLRSCTNSLAIFTFQHGSHKIYLIDTPGFDDTTQSDIDTLKTIAHYLGVSYANRVYIGGIVYLHRISDNRMTGTNRRNINMFKALCGEETYSNVVIATTMWSAEEHSQCLSKEGQLFQTDDWFGDMCGFDKARRFRHAEFGGGAKPERASALDIVLHLIEQAQIGPVVLQIQSELVDDRRVLEDTESGKILLGDIAIMREDFKNQMNIFQKDFAAQLHGKDQEVVDALEKFKKEEQDLTQRAKESEEALKASLLQMHQKEEQRVLLMLKGLEHDWKTGLAAQAQELHDLNEAIEAQQQALDVEDRANNRNALQEEFESAKYELKGLQVKFDESEKRVEKKKVAGSKIREALASGTASGMMSGITSGTIAVAVPLIVAGLMCNVM